MGEVECDWDRAWDGDEDGCDCDCDWDCVCVDDTVGPGKAAPPFALDCWVPRPGPCLDCGSSAVLGRDRELLLLLLEMVLPSQNDLNISSEIGKRRAAKQTCARRLLGYFVGDFDVEDGGGGRRNGGRQHGLRKWNGPKTAKGMLFNNNNNKKSRE